MASRTDAESLWDFALALYSSPDVEETVLCLQDEGGANVCILLWACWLETRSIALTPDMLLEAEAAIGAWEEEIVSVLRRLRRQLKPLEQNGEPAAELRSLIKKAELVAEHRSLNLLSAIQGTPSPGERQPGENADVYLDSLGIEADLKPIKSALISLSAA